MQQPTYHLHNTPHTPPPGTSTGPVRPRPSTNRLPGCSIGGRMSRLRAFATPERCLTEDSSVMKAPGFWQDPVTWVLPYPRPFLLSLLRFASILPIGLQSRTPVDSRVCNSRIQCAEAAGAERGLRPDRLKQRGMSGQSADRTSKVPFVSFVPLCETA